MSPVPTIARRTRRSLRVQAAATLRRSGGRADHRTALVVFVAALVLGIVGMHSLGGHGSAGTSDATLGPAAIATGMTGGMTGHAVDSARAHAGTAGDIAMPTSMVSGDDSIQGSGHGTGHGSGHGMSMPMLCAVMLAAAALTLLALLVVGIIRPLFPVAFHPAAVRARALQWIRGTGPPYEWQFSVIRC